jgi:hypothetical protein
MTGPAEKIGAVKLHLILSFRMGSVKRRQDALHRSVTGGKRGTKPGLKIADQNEKRPPGNRAAFSSGRIVPTEASHQNFPGAILWACTRGVKAKSRAVLTH